MMKLAVSVWPFSNLRRTSSKLEENRPGNPTAHDDRFDPVMKIEEPAMAGDVGHGNL
jgi:hypothetical protein